MYMCDISFKAFYTGNVSMLASTRSFVSEVMHRRIWSGYVRTSMKYSCRSTQNSEEGRAHAAPRQTRKKPQRNNSKRKWENRSEYERWGEKKNTQNCIYSNKENIMCMQKAVLGKKKKKRKMNCAVCHAMLVHEDAHRSILTLLIMLWMISQTVHLQGSSILYKAHWRFYSQASCGVSWVLFCTGMLTDMFL